jgi:hypothetical protein
LCCDKKAFPMVVACVCKWCKSVEH